MKYLVNFFKNSIQLNIYPGCCLTLIQSNLTATKLSRETEDEWSREGGVRDWSFRLHSFMAGEAPSPTWVYCQSYSS
jgi:hypothetical protein